MSMTDRIWQSMQTGFKRSLTIIMRPREGLSAEKYRSMLYISLVNLSLLFTMMCVLPFWIQAHGVMDPVTLVLLHGLVWALIVLGYIRESEDHLLPTYVTAAATVINITLSVLLTGRATQILPWLCVVPLMCMFLCELRIAILAFLITLLDILILGAMGAFGYLPEPEPQVFGSVLVENILTPMSFVICLTIMALMFEDTRRVAQRSNELKSSFLANMSHEIRTPLNGLLGMLSLLQEERLNERQRDYVTTAHSSGTNLLELLNDILDLSRMEVGELTMESQPFDLLELLESVCLAATPSAGTKGIRVMMSEQGVYPSRFLGDPKRIRQIVTNLVGNAIKFTDEGHIIVSLEMIPMDTENYQVVIGVEDTGVGIETDAHQMVFEKFHQRADHRLATPAGTGLGLAICRQLAALMGGTIRLESVLGEGSRFLVCLPLTLESGTPRGAELTIPPRGERAMVWAPYAPTRSLVQARYAQLGVQTSAARSLDDLEDQLAAACHAGVPYDMVFVDLDARSHEALTELAALSVREDLGEPALVLSGFALSCDDIDFPYICCVPWPLTWTTLERALDESQRLRVARREGHDPDEDHDGDEITASIRYIHSDDASHVLLVEDHPVNQKVATMMLRLLGYRVTVANNGQEALDRLEQDYFDGVLMDVQMPVMNGIDATRAIRAHANPGIAGIPIVAVTAQAMEQDRHRCLDAGASAYLTKPIDRAKLSETLEDLIQVA